MTYRSFTHVAIRVEGLREAERYYRDLFGLDVAFREAQAPDGWRTLPEGAGWDEADDAGISLSMCVLWRGAFRLALEEASSPDRAGVLDHIGLLVETDDVEVLRGRADRLGVTTTSPRAGLLILEDRYGVRWEVTTTVRDDPRSESNGAVRGRWLELDIRDE